MNRFYVGILALGVCAGSLAVAPAASADEASFLAALDKSGADRTSDERALQLARGVCTGLRRGDGMQQAYRTMSTDLAGWIGSSSAGTSDKYFRLAIANLCPEWMPR
ncbi:hypothetical protein EB75_01330 [Mycobacterium sp. ST-F2]|uniref:DUF732 domain-containing protein n=1 Tax=Mycobacterium sp. ST-F2 TaxID=1490484 RepID=UPI000938AF43|nr:DUF732 domain-containing protein [Mycobacterium sp. ST-F2]OKH77572.1 hypothetical protein EB75_01330 [Mycobacterium sp. ST-F2]